MPSLGTPGSAGCAAVGVLFCVSCWGALASRGWGSRPRCEALTLHRSTVQATPTRAFRGETPLLTRSLAFDQGQSSAGCVGRWPHPLLANLNPVPWLRPPGKRRPGKLMMLLCSAPRRCSRPGSRRPAPAARPRRRTAMLRTRRARGAAMSASPSARTRRRRRRRPRTCARPGPLHWLCCASVSSSLAVPHPVALARLSMKRFGGAATVSTLAARSELGAPGRAQRLSSRTSPHPARVDVP